MTNIPQILHSASQDWDDTRAHHYDRESSSKGYIEAVVRLLSLGQEERGKDIVDLGCGTGISTLAIHEALKPRALFAVDPSPSMLALAKVKLASYPKVELIQGVAENLASVVDRADAVVDASSFMYYTDPDLALDQIGKVLPRGGGFYLYTAVIVGTKFFGTIKVGDTKRPFTGKNYDQTQIEGFLGRHRFRSHKLETENVMRNRELVFKHLWCYARKR